MEVPPQKKNSPPQIENRDFAIFDDFYIKMAIFWPPPGNRVFWLFFAIFAIFAYFRYFWHFWHVFIPPMYPLGHKIMSKLCRHFFCQSSSYFIIMRQLFFQLEGRVIQHASYIIIQHHASSSYKIIHHTSSYIMHHTSSYIIMHHTSSYIMHHTSSYIIIKHASYITHHTTSCITHHTTCKTYNIHHANRYPSPQNRSHVKQKS